MPNPSTVENPEALAPFPVSKSDFFVPTNTETPRFEYLDDPIHARMKSNSFYGKRIQLRSTYGKSAQPVNLEPSHERGYDNRWLGIPKLTNSQRELMEKHGFVLAVPGETFVKAPDGFDIDCGTEQGLYLWEWMQYAPQIISDTDTYDHDKPHEGADKEFYVIVPADEVEKRAKGFVDRFAAADWIRTLSPRKWYDVARLIGSGMDGATQVDVFNYLMDLSERTPQRLLDVKKDNQADTRLFIKRLIDKGIIKIQDGGYRYNDLLLGTSEHQVLDTISMGKHADVVQYMRNQLGVDGGFGNVEVKTSYASYESNKQVMAQAAAPSSTLGHAVPKSSTTKDADLNITGGELTNQDLDDDYVDDEDDSESNTSSVISPVTSPSNARVVGVMPKPRGGTFKSQGSANGQSA